jgi:ATP-dependent RNA helicase DeaD
MSTPVPFAELGLAEPFLEALIKRGFTMATPVQAAAFAPGLEGRDLLVQSRTGSGKTLAFGLPLLHRLSAELRPQALVLAPTRELAQQVGAELEALKTVRLAMLVGGLSYSPQLRSLERGAQVVVGTPGRVMDHLERGSLDLSGVTMVVLDEADEMLNMGFLEDVESILSKVPKNPQTFLFSATLPTPIATLAQRFLKDPVRLQLSDKSTGSAHADIAHTPVQAPDHLQIRALVNLLLAEEPKAALIFTRTKAKSEDAAEELTASGLPAAFLHGDLAQSTRERILEQFKSGHLRFLVATDVAARGIDIQGLPLVVHLSIPTQMEGYIHRSGRTGRAGAKGTSMPIVNAKEARILNAWARRGGLDLQWRTVPGTEEIKKAQAVRLRSRIQEAQGDPERAKALIDELGAEKAVAGLLALLEAERSDGFELRIPTAPVTGGAGRFDRDDSRPKVWKDKRSEGDKDWVPADEWKRQREEAIKARRPRDNDRPFAKKDEDRPARPAFARKEEDRPARPFRKDDDRPARPFRKDEDKARPYAKKTDDKPARAYAKKDDTKPGRAWEDRPKSASRSEERGPKKVWGAPAPKKPRKG